MSVLDNGGYNVQPIEHPYSHIIDTIISPYVRGIIIRDMLLIRGYIISDDPNCVGTR